MMEHEVKVRYESVINARIQYHFYNLRTVDDAEARIDVGLVRRAFSSTELNGFCQRLVVAVVQRDSAHGELAC